MASNSYVNPNAKAGLEKMKYEVANDGGVKNLFYFYLNIWGIFLHLYSSEFVIYFLIN